LATKHNCTGSKPQEIVGWLPFETTNSMYNFFQPREISSIGQCRVVPSVGKPLTIREYEYDFDLPKASTPADAGEIDGFTLIELLIVIVVLASWLRS